MRYVLILLICLLAGPCALAGTTYQVTANSDGQVVEYNVNFGGGRMFEMYTAYDPASGEFVYLRFNRGQAAPEPAAQIWDHTTGRTIDLYDFPGVDHPLPVIPSIEDMAVCPKTGDANYKAVLHIIHD